MKSAPMRPALTPRLAARGTCRVEPRMGVRIGFDHVRIDLDRVSVGVGRPLLGRQRGGVGETAPLNFRRQ